MKDLNMSLPFIRKSIQTLEKSNDPFNKITLYREWLNQHPMIFHPFFLASAQMHGQQCFLSASKSFAHFMSAITSVPEVSKAAAQFLTVNSISTAHSTSRDSVHYSAIQGCSLTVEIVSFSL